MEYLDMGDSEYYEKLPKVFNRYSEKEILKYGVATNLYMNGLMDVYNKIKGSIKNVGAITICFEDTIKESELTKAEENIYNQLSKIANAIKKGILDINKIPLIFIRVRNVNQFKNFARKLKDEEARCICGFVFPKFNVENANEYLDFTQELSMMYDIRFYAMPILESKEIIYKESRILNLIAIKDIIKKYDDIILNIRVGGTDFSSNFALRRSVKSTIYDIRVVSDCLIDIINVFTREDANYIVSGPVFEYFSNDRNSKEVNTLINEIRLDLENGFCGKTVIHPYQVSYINSSFVVNYDEYMDAKNILNVEETGGVFKGSSDNKMNEVKPHTNWARKILERANVFGVLKEGVDKELLY